MGIGIVFRCKVNANIGVSLNTSDINEEVAKLHLKVYDVFLSRTHVDKKGL